MKHYNLISLNGLFAPSLKQASQGGPIPFLSNSRPTLFPMLYVFAKVDCMPCTTFSKACFKRRATAVLSWLVSVVSNSTQSDKIAVAENKKYM